MTRRRFTPSLILLVLGCLTAHQAAAAPVYSTAIRNHVNGTIVFTGVMTVSGTIFFGGGGTGGGTATVGIAPASTTSMLMSSFVNLGGGTVPDVDLDANAEFFDVIFTDIANPANNGTIQVSGNYLLGLAGTAGLHTELRPNIDLGTASIVGGVFVGGVPAGIQTGPLITVNLNTPYTLSMMGRHRLTGGTGTGTGFLALADVPFNLPEGFTVNSADADIVDNFLGGPPGPPHVPALGPWGQAILFALLPLVLLTRRHALAARRFS